MVELNPLKKEIINGWNRRQVGQDLIKTTIVFIQFTKPGYMYIVIYIISNKIVVY